MAEPESIKLKNGSIVLYKREGSPRWQARLKLTTGRWHRVSTKTDDIETAREIALVAFADVMKRVKGGLKPTPRSFGSIARELVEDLRSEADLGAGKEIYKDYIRVINKYMVPFFGKREIPSIRQKDILEYYKHYIAVLGRTPKKSTFNTHNAALKRIFYFAIEREYITTYGLPTLKNFGAPGERREYFTRSEADKLRQVIEGRFRSRFFADKTLHKRRKEKSREVYEIVHFLAYFILATGIRPGTEAKSVRWKDITGLGMLDDHVEVEVTGKTGRRPVVAEHCVREIVNLQIDQRWDDDPPPDMPIFSYLDGTYPADLAGAFETLLDELGLLESKNGKRRSLYSLRHTYATERVLSGLSFPFLASNMGTSIAMIEKHYSHLTAPLVADIIAGLNKEKAAVIESDAIAAASVMSFDWEKGHPDEHDDEIKEITP